MIGRVTPPRQSTQTAARLWAACALVVALATVAFAIVAAVWHFPSGLAVLACLLLAVVGAAYGVRRRGWRRVAGLAAAAALVIGAITIAIVERRVLEDLLVFAGVAVTLTAARLAFRAQVQWPRARRPSYPVLFYNPLSGGGKATRFHLAEEARARGIQPIELRRGDDLEQLVRDAVDRGADALAMAGGDGSQAIVAWIAAELDLPYACIPSGTRNHFALDLGVDRDDVVGALDAFVDGGERRVDLAEVNGRVFVNNVSLGLYAEAVQKPGYRAAKLHTLLETVPESIGPDAKLPNLTWSGRAGREAAAAILVSNNPYRLGRAIGSGTRPRLDRGVLGIAVLAPVRAAGNGPVRHKLQLEQWTAQTFQMDADSRVAAGIDGEAMRLEPPLRFRTWPGALRVRIAPGHPGASPSAFEPDHPRQMIGALVRLAVHGTPGALHRALPSAADLRQPLGENDPRRSLDER
jgi:diacylglycerol kinase family enzyme